MSNLKSLKLSISDINEVDLLGTILELRNSRHTIKPLPKKSKAKTSTKKSEKSFGRKSTMKQATERLNDTERKGLMQWMENQIKPAK